MFGGSVEGWGRLRRENKDISWKNKVLLILPPPPGNRENQTIAFSVGLAVFKKDKMIGRINSKATRGALWLKNEIKSNVFTVKASDEEGFVSLNLIRSITKLIPQIKDGKWQMSVHVEMENNILQNTTNLDMGNPEFSKMLEKELENNVKDSINLALTQVQQKMNADIFGFAEAFHRKYPELWKTEKYRWDQIFPEVAVTVEGRFKVQRPGMITQGANMPEKEVKKK
jgi:spore germination protein KC